MIELAQINIALNQLQNNVQLICCGISDKEEYATFGAENPANFGAMRLQQTQNGGILCKSLDSFEFNEPIVMMKIDIEGMEAKALRGAQKLIEKNRPILYLEAQKLEEFKHIDRILFKMNYVHWDFFGGALTHLYLPREQVSTEDLQVKALSSVAAMHIQWSWMPQQNLIYKTLLETAQNVQQLANRGKFGI